MFLRGAKLFFIRLPVSFGICFALHLEIFPVFIRRTFIFIHDKQSYSFVPGDMVNGFEVSGYLAARNLSKALHAVHYCAFFASTYIYMYNIYPILRLLNSYR